MIEGRPGCGRFCSQDTRKPRKYGLARAVGGAHSDPRANSGAGQSSRALGARVGRADPRHWSLEPPVLRVSQVLGTMRRLRALSVRRLGWSGRVRR